MSRFDDAIRNFDLAIGMGSVLAHSRKGNALMGMSDFAGARAEFLIYLELDPEDQCAASPLIGVLWRLGLVGFRIFESISGPPFTFPGSSSPSRGRGRSCGPAAMEGHHSHL